MPENNRHTFTSVSSPTLANGQPNPKEMAPLRKLRLAYEAALAALSTGIKAGVLEADPVRFAKLREDKLAAAQAYSRAHAAAEGDFYKDEVAEMQETLKLYKEQKNDEPAKL